MLPSCIKSYVISNLTGSTFDGFIDCAHILTAMDFSEDLDIIDEKLSLKLG